ncbi:hypothetical protein [Coraliomargarita akajimensis]|nr:hypothetical protein [Coraliomargarita akajimensis]
MPVSKQKRALFGFCAVLCASIIAYLTVRSTGASNSEVQTPAASHPTAVKMTGPAIGSDETTAETLEATPEPSLADRMNYILEDAHIASERYRLLVSLLESDESAVLAFLAERRYPDELTVHDAAHREIEMITRAMLEYYRRQPLNENLSKMEQLRETGPLFSSIVTDLLFASEGAASVPVAYDWVLANPEDPAALRSGATVGGLLIEHSPNEAWSKAVDLPEGVIRSRAFSTILAVAAHDDVGIAIDYINSIEETPDLDAAISHVLTQAMHADYAYDQLVEIAMAPVDDTYRLSSLVILFNEWAVNSPDSLVQWVQEPQNYPEEQLIEMRMVAKQTLHGNLVDFESP